MSGPIDKIFLDTNALIAFANKDSELINYVSQTSVVFISIISFLEFKVGERKHSFLTFSIEDFIQNSDLIDLSVENIKLIDMVITVRRDYKLKLPDAIIAASAIVNEATLITNDKEFSKIKELKTKSFK
jgi:tRNA(fMet)-specific endonuclease VapC